MKKINICINTQTPLVKFNITNSDLEKTNEGMPPLNLNNAREGKDYHFTPGGVTRMIYPLLKMMLNRGLAENVHWVSLNPHGPEESTIDGINLSHISMAPDRIKGYGFTKEVIWSTIHGLPNSASDPSDIFWQDEYSDFTYYNRLSTERMLKLDKNFDFDLFYIHDFQQLPIGHMLNTLKPKIFRWHIPFDESTIPLEWKEFLSIYLNSYDRIVVSCKKYLKALKSFGYTGKSCLVYPYIDPAMYSKPTPSEAIEFCTEFGISNKDKVVLVVARLDPMKGQDRAIKAIAKAIKDVPNIKLVLAGNGSFSSSKQGVNLSKAEKWLSELKNLAECLGIRDHVIFTGHLTQSQLNAAYQRSDVVVLPSIREGFGLVVIEGWLFKKPVIVTSKAGISEMIKENHIGAIYKPDDIEALSDKIIRLLLDKKYAKSLGERGNSISKKCYLDRGINDELEIINELM